MRFRRAPSAAARSPRCLSTPVVRGGPWRVRACPRPTAPHMATFWSLARPSRALFVATRLSPLELSRTLARGVHRLCTLDTPRGASRRRVASLSRPTRPDRSHRGVPVPTRTLFEHKRSTGHGTVDRSSELNRATRNACDGAVATLLNYIELLLKCLQLNLCP